MPNIKAVLFVASAAIAGCATTTNGNGLDSTNEAQGSKYRVGQMGPVEAKDFVLCKGADCSPRSEKFIAVTRRVPVVAAPVVPKEPAPKAEAIIPAPTFTVNFRWGWHRLDKEGERQLKAVLDYLANKPTPAKVVVAGRTDPTGPQSFNEKLAIRRANEVRQRLIAAGINGDLIQAVAQQPCCDGNPNAAATTLKKLRRTDIEITIKTTTR